MISKKNFLLFLKNNNLLHILLILICICPFLLGLESIPPLDRDEARFTQSSYQMVKSNDYVNINFQDEIRANKPIGIYWIQAFSANIFGLDKIFSYRLPSCLAAFLSLITIWFFSKKLFGTRVSIFISLYLATNLLFVFESHIAKTDSILLSTICLQQFLLFLILLNKEKNLKFDLLIPTLLWISISIGVLIKGPISIIIFFLTILSYCFIKQKISIFLKTKPILGIFIVALIVLPWVLNVQETSGGMFLKKALTEDFFPKLISQQEGHGGYPGYYILLSSIIFWPLACYIPTTIFFIFKNKENVAIQFLLCWIIPYWLILELMPTKLIHYPLPVVPAFIMLITASIIYFENQEINIKNIKYKHLMFSLSTFLGLGGIIFGIIVLYLAIYFGKNNDHSIVTYSIICLCFILIIFLLTCYKNFKMIYKVDIKPSFLIYCKKLKSLNLIIIFTSCVYILILGLIIPNLTQLFPSQSIYDKLKNIKYDAVSAIGYYEPSLVFLLKGNVILSDTNEGAIFLAEGKNNLVLVEERDLESFKISSKNLDLKLNKITHIDGYNYSKGKKVKIFFIKGFIDENRD